VKERAFVRITIPQKIESPKGEEDKKEGTQTIEKDDLYGVGDIEDKVKLAIPRVDGVAYHVGVINQVV
jgi:hypothetical protein